MIRVGVKFAIVLAFASFTAIYVVLWPFVGRFPAESIAVSSSDSVSSRSLCFDARATARNISPGNAELREFRGASLAVHEHIGTGPQLGQLAGSRALFYSVLDKRIYQINQLDPPDRLLLNQFVFWGLVEQKSLETFLSSSTPFSAPCDAPVTDQGVTEAYWATKGTAVLHHWAFLYDAAISDAKPVHAQYGYLVARSAREIGMLLKRPGPTQFVRISWGLFWFIGICYCAAFLYVFRSNLFIAVGGLSWQIAAFASIGGFSILLAPGYHWSKELVMIMPPLLFTVGPGRRRNGSTALKVVAVIGVLALALALDPTFAIVVFACAIFGLCTRYSQEIVRSLKSRPATIVGVALLAFLATCFALFVDASNIGYALSKTLTFGVQALSDPARNLTLELNAALALGAVVLCARKRIGVVGAYYAYLSVISFEYYVITPDSFHFAKYIEYVIPLYVVVGSAAYALLHRNPWSELARPIVDGALLVSVVFLSVSSYNSLTAVPPYWQLRTVDDLGSPYFSSVPTVINGRLIDANIDPQTVEHLVRFPRLQKNDYIVSPLDKYLLFIYDEHNGFDSVDATAWLDSDAKLVDIERELTTRHAVTIVDASEFSVDPLAAILSTANLGADNSQSVLNVKSRVRMAELAVFLRAHCSLTQSKNARLWFVARC